MTFTFHDISMTCTVHFTATTLCGDIKNTSFARARKYGAKNGTLAVFVSILTKQSANGSYNFKRCECRMRLVQFHNRMEQNTVIVSPKA